MLNAVVECSKRVFFQYRGCSFRRERVISCRITVFEVTGASMVFFVSNCNYAKKCIQSLLSLETTTLSMSFVQY
jgi:hypothetical protein